MIIGANICICLIIIILSPFNNKAFYKKINRLFQAEKWITNLFKVEGVFLYGCIRSNKVTGRILRET
jgi:hypothetical protein